MSVKEEIITSPEDVVRLDYSILSELEEFYALPTYELEEEKSLDSINGGDEYQKCKLNNLKDLENLNHYNLYPSPDNYIEDKTLSAIDDKEIDNIDVSISDLGYMYLLNKNTTLNIDNVEIESTKPQKNDKYEMVNHPSHYGGENNPYEVIKVIDAYNLNFNLGSALKYLLRKDKPSTISEKDRRIEDLNKAIWYIQHEIENLKIKNIGERE